MIRYASCVWELPMPTTFRAYQPDQPLLLPPDLQEWVPPGHLAHHVSDVVDALDLMAFYAPYEGDGRRNAPYEPSMMVKVLIYAYATGTFSSRAVARKLEEDVAFRMLAAGNFPQHRTVCEFRRRHLAEFSELFVGVVQVACEMGLARFGKLSVDGTKVRANASKRKAMSYERMGKEAARLQAEIEALLTKAGMLDEINETFGVEPAVVLADAGYCNEPDLLELEDRGIDAHVALGREGKSQVTVDPARLPATHRMGEKLASPAGKARYAATQVALGGAERVDQGGARMPPIQPARLGEGARRVGPPVLGVEHQADGDGGHVLRQVRACQRTCSGARSAH